MVIGSGVTGLTTAVSLAEAGLRVRIRTAALPEATSSAAAGALWGPYLSDAGRRNADWAEHTLGALRGLAEEPETGVRLVRGVEAARGEVTLPDWAPLVPDLRRAQAAELPKGYADGYVLTLPLLDMPAYLDYLMSRFRLGGGQIEVRRVHAFEEAAQEAPVVVNCAGFDAGALAGDPEVRAVRGQVLVVDNPGLEDFFCATDEQDGELTYILPHGSTVVLGGSAEDGVTGRQADASVAQRILRRCVEVEPRLSGARTVAHRAGLRPVRPTVRLETEQIAGGSALLVHNYGHGGSGITLSWGCAGEVASQVLAAL